MKEKNLLIFFASHHFDLSVNAQCTSSQGGTAEVFLLMMPAPALIRGTNPKMHNPPITVCFCHPFIERSLFQLSESNWIWFFIPTTASICVIEVNVERSRLG